MKKIYFLLVLIGCSSEKSQQKVNIKEKKSDSIYPIERSKLGISDISTHDFKQFTSLFRTITFDTLHIYNNDNGGDKTLIEKGIPNQYLKYFSKEVRLGATDWNIDSIYAIYKFSYSPEVTALIARVPSENSSSAYNIFLYSNKNQNLLHSQRLAEFTGDAGNTSTENSWLFKLDNDKYIDIVTKEREQVALDEDLTKFAYYDSTYVFFGTPDGFRKTSKFLGISQKFILKEE